MKIHHSMADGLAISSICLLMCQNPNVKDLIGFKPLSYFKWAAIYISMPFVILKESMNMLMKKPERNPIKSSKAPSGKKNGAINMDVDLAKIKKASKHMGYTLNDIFTSILVLTFSEYFKRHKNEGPAVQNICISVPFSLREPCKSLEDVEINNNIGLLDIDLPLWTDFSKTIKHVNKLFNKMKTSFKPFAI